jgi:hypothetical protein
MAVNAEEHALWQSGIPTVLSTVQFEVTVATGGLVIETGGNELELVDILVGVKIGGLVVGVVELELVDVVVGVVIGGLVVGVVELEFVDIVVGVVENGEHVKLRAGPGLAAQFA